jgi:ADP-ribose pyrophosphatase YjhB (NUDIX family)
VGPLAVLLMRMNYCPLCRSELVSPEPERPSPQSCPACGFRNWESPAPVATALLLRAGRVVLVRSYTRGNEWGLPSGFVENRETAETGLLREIKEETNLAARITGWLGTYPIFNGKKWILLIAYEAVVEGEGGYSPSEEISEIQELEPGDALKMLKGKEEKEILASWMARNQSKPS